MAEVDLDLGRYRLSWGDESDGVDPLLRGLDEDLIREISWMKGEPAWMRDFRLRSHEIFTRTPVPTWGGDASEIAFDGIFHHVAPTEHQFGATEELPQSAKDESEAAYHKNHQDLEAQGVLFCDMDTAVRDHPELVRSYFGTVISPGDNKVAALNSAVWSGGSFIYVPPGIEVEMPLQAHFRMNADKIGQFERTLIIVDEGAKVQYVEGCSAPVYTSDSLHSAVAELVAKDHGCITYTTIQNWSPNVFNLVTKRAVAHEGAHVEWIDGNFGSRLTTKSPAVHLAGPKASGEVRSLAYAGAGQHQDVGAEMVHAAPETTSKIVSKSISRGGGRTTFRGVVRVADDAHGCRTHVQSDALVLDESSHSDTCPIMDIGAADAVVGHEATVSRVAGEQLFYLQSRGLTEEQAMGIVVNAFIEPVTRTLPLAYAVEWSRLIELQMEGSVG